MFITDSAVIGRVRLLSYGCAYRPTRRSSTPHSSISSSTREPGRSRSVRGVESAVTGCESVTTTTMTDPIGAGLFERLRVVDNDDLGDDLGATDIPAVLLLQLQSSDVTGQLCHCVSDDCNSAWPTITGLGCWWCWAPAVFIWTSFILVFTF